MSDAAQLLSAPQVQSEAVLTSLINDLDTRGINVVLVLDDYQFIRSQAVHEAVAFLLEHCPHTLHMVIATRSDPPLPLPRLRVRSQVLELRADDLRFTGPEATQFLNDIMGLHLDREFIAVLEERTEGWIAGLQMAALSMRGREDVLGFIKGFSGTNRYILDFLLEEALASQSPEIQHFLLYTSVLDRLTASLCDTVLTSTEDLTAKGNDPSTCTELISLQGSASILEYLERANLFLVPLDDERTWYRYHHLFADLLASRLQQIDPQMIPLLHSRASAWYEQNGWLYQAVEHAFSAGDLDRAAQLIESDSQKLVYQVPFATIQNWINRLPEEIVLQKVWIGVTQGWLWVATGRISSLS
ncbi:MAG: hypothetical protein ACM3PS_00325, partial [Syntrophothermus sp.]